MWIFVGVRLVVQKKQNTDVHVVCGIPAGMFVNLICDLSVYHYTSWSKKTSSLFCSLPCVKKHKTELTCNGIREKTAYVSIQQFTEMNLLSGKLTFV